jgi:hypothetical protein
MLDVKVVSLTGLLNEESLASFFKLFPENCLKSGFNRFSYVLFYYFALGSSIFVCL